jgi:uncharacterized protein YndB with AHSA1/START domain
MTDRFEASTSIDVEAAPARVWQVLTEPEYVRRYMHDTELDTDWREGGPIVWRGEWQGKQYEDKGEVTTFRPQQLLSVTHWSPLTGEPDTPEHYHQVTYELQPLSDELTRLVLTHGNSPSQEAADGMIEGGWSPLLQELRNVAQNT